MQLSQFSYELPENLIAKFPPIERGSTRLMVIDRKTGNISHKLYSDIPSYINTGDVVVLNNTKVERVRVFLKNKRNNRRVQCIILTKVYLGEGTKEYREAVLGCNRKIKDKDILVSENGYELEVQHKVMEAVFLLASDIGIFDKLINDEGHIPLPPYLNREDNNQDYVRYNTVFAKQIGSSAAPTASLNVTDSMLDIFKEKGIDKVEVNLEVGWGTFSPIREEIIENHKIHEERIHISKDSADRINNRKGDVWAFGTTATRTLESCTKNKEIIPYEGTTNIYIYPGYDWKIVDHMITNFHAPQSSLLVMISAFIGYELAMKSYNIAIKEKYNFLSYGDSMLIL